jgi:hypothetical protein
VQAEARYDARDGRVGSNQNRDAGIDERAGELSLESNGCSQVAAVFGDAKFLA